MRKPLAVLIAVLMTAFVGVPEALADPPVAFTATANAVSTTQIDLAWTDAEEPLPLVPGAPVTYSVAVVPPGGTVTVTGLGATVTGLLPSTSYSFTITATNAELPDTQATASATTQAATSAPGAPTGVTIVPDGNQTGVIVNWTDGTAGSPAETYTVQVNPIAGGAPVAPQTTNRGTQTISFPGLTAGTYSATVTATNIAGNAAGSTTVPATVLAAPGTFTVTAAATSATQINASWTSAGGSPTATYSAAISPADGSVGTVNQAGRTVSFTGLNPATAYTVTITATNGAGSSNDSDTATTTAALTPPGAFVVTASVASSTSVSLDWPAVSGNPPPTYSVVVSPAGGTASVSGSSASVTGLTPGTTYTFTVTATNSQGNSSDSATATPNALPAAPTGVSASNPTATSVDVSWTAPANTGSAVTGYRVTANPGGLVQPTGGATSVTFPGLSPNTTYTFTVVAQNAAGFSPASSSASETTSQALTAPGSFDASASTASSSQVNLDWPGVSGNPAPTYSVAVSPAGGTVSLNGSSATVSGLSSGTTYTFTVTASNSEGTSSDAVSATTYSAPGSFGLSATATSSSSVNLSWDDAGGNPGPVYTVTVSPSGGTISVSGRSATITGLTPGTTYTFTVTATNAAGSSNATQTATPVGIPNTPGNVSAARGDEAVNTAVVTWEAPSTNGTPVTGYEITVDGRDPEVIDDPTATSFEIGSLDPGTYTVSVVARSAAGNSPAGVSNSVLIPDVPGILNNIVASNDSPFGRNVTISWEAPQDDGGLPITGYRVTMAGASTVAPPNSNLARIGPLPVGFHTATIQAIGPAGDGPILQSNQVEVRGFSPFVSVDSFINQQYLDFLGRSADAGGRAFWASRTNADGSNVEDIINSFMESPEFGPRRSVVRLYEAYFGRLPDLAGFDFWSTRLATGQGSLEEVSQFFASGDEFQATYGALTDAEFVNLVYANVLDRSPDDAGRDFWTTQLAEGLDRGRLMTLFSESPEFIGTSRPHVDVVVTYRGLLNRLPDSEGYAFWTERIGSDPDALGTLIRLFYTSPEYAERITP